jgi:hypothetical protein
MGRDNICMAQRSHHCPFSRFWGSVDSMVHYSSMGSRDCYGSSTDLPSTQHHVRLLLLAVHRRCHAIYGLLPPYLVPSDQRRQRSSIWYSRPAIYSRSRLLQYHRRRRRQSNGVLYAIHDRMFLPHVHRSGASDYSMCR